MKSLHHPAKKRSRLRLRVSRTAEATVRAGHPWVFAESIREQNREGAPGEFAIIYDRFDRFLAVGLFDPYSPIRVRMLHSGTPLQIDRAWWTRQLLQAKERRRGIFDEETTGFRWINGESDGWPGLVLDRYDETLVLKLYTSAWVPHLDELLVVIQAQLNPRRVVLRLSRNIQPAVTKLFRRSDGELLSGPLLAGPVAFRESGLIFEADVARGQKTGFFLDQRDNRRKVGGLAPGTSVLNAFSFSGGFSLYAARSGAVCVTELDISAHALSAARRNFSLNRAITPVAQCQLSQIQADAFEWFFHPPARKFDLIILDPPSLAKRETDRAGALRAYHRLAGHAIKRLSKRGILVACSCSAHVSAEEFFRTIRAAATRPGRRCEVIETTRNAPDHPVSFKEADYLKAIYLAFS